MKPLQQRRVRRAEPDRAESVGGANSKAVRYDRVERALDLPMLFLGLAFIPVLVVPVVDTQLPVGVRWVLSVANWSIWLAFLVEYLVLMFLAPKRLAYVRSHLVDLLIVAVPFLRPLRIVRSVRALQSLRLARVASGGSAGMSRAKRHLSTVASAWAAVLTAATVLMAAVLVLDAERDNHRSAIHSFATAIWWAVDTITYQSHNIMPVTVEGRLIAVGLSVVGACFLGVLTASFAAWIIHDDNRGQNRGGQTDLAVLVTQIEALRAEVAELRLPPVPALLNGSDQSGSCERAVRRPHDSGSEG